MKYRLRLTGIVLILCFSISGCASRGVFSSQGASQDINALIRELSHQPASNTQNDTIHIEFSAQTQSLLAESKLWPLLNTQNRQIIDIHFSVQQDAEQVERFIQAVQLCDELTDILISANHLVEAEYNPKLNLNVFEFTIQQPVLNGANANGR